MHLLLVAPEAEQSGARLDQRVDGATPGLGADSETRPWAMRLGLASALGDVSQYRHGQDLSKQPCHRLKPGDQRGGEIDAGGEHQREMHEHRNIGALHFVVRALRLTEGNAIEL